MPKLGGSGNLIYGDKVYKPGDNVPMAADVAEHNEVYGGVVWDNTDKVSPKEQAAAAAAAVGLDLDGDPLPVHPVTGVPAPIETFPKAVPPTAKTSVSPTVVVAAPAVSP